MLVWRADIDKFISEFIRLDGRGDFSGQTLCGRCGVWEAEYRCRDCTTEALYCKGCTVEFHSHNPFHRIEVRASSFYQSPCVLTLSPSSSVGPTHVSSSRYHSNHSASPFN